MKIRSSQWLALVLVLFLTGCNNAGREPATSPTGQDPDPYRLDEDVRPVMQLLDLNIDPSRTDYSGSTMITIDIASDRPQFRLHAKDMRIDR